jgi:hypothetical protein
LVNADITDCTKIGNKQVDYTAAFVHAPINKDPNWEKMTPEKQFRSGIYIQLPRGFTQPGKALKLKSLFTDYSKCREISFSILCIFEAIRFQSQEDIDPCLFISDKVICLVYVDDTLFYFLKSEYIDEVIQKLRECGMNLEVEREVAGFLDVHIE